jgi:hypothetical protein
MQQFAAIQQRQFWPFIPRKIHAELRTCGKSAEGTDGNISKEYARLAAIATISERISNANSNKRPESCSASKKETSRNRSVLEVIDGFTGRFGSYAMSDTMPNSPVTGEMMVVGLPRTSPLKPTSGQQRTAVSGNSDRSLTDLDGCSRPIADVTDRGWLRLNNS